MKKIIFPALLSVILFACSSNKKEETKETPPAQQVKTDTPEKDGTSIKINNDGVSVESKDGSNKTDVKLSKDSTLIDISRKK
jgi:hypothetical protein